MPLLTPPVSAEFLALAQRSGAGAKLFETGKSKDLISPHVCAYGAGGFREDGVSVGYMSPRGDVLSACSVACFAFSVKWQ